MEIGYKYLRRIIRAPLLRSVTRSRECGDTMNHLCS